MLISLIAWIYLSIICLIWGHIFLSVVTAAPGESAGLHISLVCLAGLAVISTLGLLLDLFMPLDWKAHILLLIGALIHLLGRQRRNDLQTLLKNAFKSFTPLQYGLLAACVAMTLVIGVHSITHPDTLIYHASSILLFQRYTTIPGIANLMPHFGFQSGWFAALALSNPTPWYHLIFLNGAVLCWFFIFVLSSWNKTWLGWLLLAYTLVSWIQVRLTAASASPDFIVTLYSWAAIISYLKSDGNDVQGRSYAVLTILFCLAAILAKLSVITLLLLALLALHRKSPRIIRNMTIYAAVALLTLFIRNVITSGYLLYPSSKPDLFPVDWKISLPHLQYLRQYITRYATIPFDGPMEPLHLSWIQKVAGWWSYIDYPDRILFLAILAGLLANIIILITKRKASPIFAWNKHTRVLLVTIIGSMFWLWNAPSPRFGTGFLVPLLYLLFYHLPQPAVRVTRLLPLVTGLCLFTAVSAYTIYRSIRFLAPSNIIIPSGIAAAAYDPRGCDDLQVDLLHDSMRITHPGTPHCSNDFNDLSPRGRTIEEGFKPD